MSPVYFVTQVLSTLRGSAPIARRKGFPQSSALRLCRPPLRSALSVRLRFLSKGGETPPLAPCYPRLRQVAFGMYMPRFNADVQKPNTQGGSTHEHHQHRHPHQRKPQTAAATADRQRNHRRQRQEPYRAVGGRTLRRPHHLPRRHEPLPQLQLWEHSGDRAADADRNPRCRICTHGSSLAAR